MATIDQRPARLDLYCAVGDDVTVTLTVLENSVSWVATGATVTTAILNQAGTVQATNFTTVASTGSLTLSLTDTQTTTLGAGQYRYWVAVTKSSLTRTWVAGTFTVAAASGTGVSSTSATLSITTGTVSLSLTSLVAPAAANITVADSGNFYTATNVEAVLAEIPTREQTLWPWYGYDVLDRDLATGTTLVTLTKDKTAFRTFTAPQDMVVTGVQMASTGTVSAGLTLCRFFLGQIVPEYGETTFTEGRFMVLARTASDTTMFNVANTLYSRSFSSVGGWPTSVRLIKGQRYFVGYYISGTTAPTVVSAAAFMRPQVNTYSTTSPLIGGYPLGIEATTDIAPAWTSGNMGYDGTAASSWYGLNCDAASTKTRPYDAVVLADSYGNSYPGWCWLGNATSGSRLNFVRADGLSGQETAAIASQVTNTLALRPKVVIVHAGINDVANTKSAASIQTNLTSIYTNLVAGGAQVILCTIPPSTSMDAGELVTLAAVNTWIKALNVTGVTIADTGNALTTGDGVTQNGSLYTDGVHPNFAGCAAMAAVLAPKITTVVTSLGG